MSFKESIQTAQRHMKRFYSVISYHGNVNQEPQGHHFIPTTMATVKMTDENKYQ